MEAIALILSFTAAAVLLMLVGRLFWILLKIVLIGFLIWFLLTRVYPLKLKTDSSPKKTVAACPHSLEASLPHSS